jgi:putative FmdB family regulatory protein
MPTYEYLCTRCRNEWEEIQKISEKAIEVCPKCGKSTAQRQISGGNFILKGGGWYSDLYSSSKPRPADANGKADAKAETKAETKSETKTETKSVTKAETKPTPPSKT